MSELININTASADDLTSLPGISEKLAARIIEYREEKGAFTTTEGLAAVPGISQRMVANMQVQIAVDELDTAVTEPVPPETPEETPSELAPEAVTATDAAAPSEEQTIEIPAEEETIAPETAKALSDTKDDDGTSASLEQPADDQPAETGPIIITAQPRIEPEPEPIESQSTESQTAVTPATTPPPPQRGSMIGSIIAAVFAAILGTALTLSILYGFNETLQYAGSSQSAERQQQLATELETLQAEQVQMQSELEALTAELVLLTENQAALAETATESQNQLDALQTKADALQTRSDDLSERLENVAQSAEDFETFLTGMRDLILQVAGTPEPTATSTPDVSESEATRIIIIPSEPATATPEQAATRTPRPTATQIGIPTVTVAPQP